MPGRIISVIVMGDKKKDSCCPACTAEMEAKSIRRPNVGSVRRKV